MEALNHSWCQGGRWWWPEITAGIWAGGAGCLQPFLESKRATVVAHNLPWSLCRQCPALCEYEHGEKDYNLAPPPHLPNNGDWPLWWPRLPPRTPSAVVALDSSLPVCLQIANPSPLPSSNLRSLSSSTQPLPAHVTLGSAGQRH